MNAHRGSDISDKEKERRKWQNPEARLASIGLKPRNSFIDVGCGDGFFTLPAARLVGETGKVYGLDADHKAISKLREKAAREKLGNIILKVGEAENNIICESYADAVFFGIVLHDFKDPKLVLTNAKKMLKSKGQLIDLDWKKEPMDLGPPLKIRFSKEEAISLIEAIDFKIDTVKNAGPYHYLVIAKP